MSSSIKVCNLDKTFVLSEPGKSVSLFDALRNGNVEEHVRKIEALSGINLEIEEGERVGIIGPNGAGKTTLLSILAGLSAPSSGSVEVKGDVHAMLTIGAVLKEELTGRENIYLDATVHGASREQVDATVEDIIAFSELEEFIERPVRTYSSGMKARLAFSMGVFIDPDILILDETLSVGDVFFSQKATIRMKEIARKGRIVILVTHSSGAIVDMCTRCLWIDAGKLIMDGDPNEVTSAYEASVRNADEKALARKFGAASKIEKRPNIGVIGQVDILQKGESCKASVAAFEPLTMQVTGELKQHSASCDLEFEIRRVDNRRIWHSSLRKNVRRMPETGEFVVCVVMDPFIFCADLYCLEVRLVDEHGVCDVATRVFEVIDEEGQFGGQPLLLYAPTIKTRRLKETGS